MSMPADFVLFVVPNKGKDEKSYWFWSRSSFEDGLDILRYMKF